MPNMARILFLTSHLPVPPISGGRRREYELLIRLSPRHHIYLCAVSVTYADDLANLSEASRFAHKAMVFQGRATEDIPRSEFRASSRALARNRSPEATAYVRDLLDGDTIDLVHAEGFYMMQHVPLDAPNVLLVEQNIEYRLLEQRAAVLERSVSTADTIREALLVREEEQDAWQRATLCATLTKGDRDVVARTIGPCRTRIVPDGFDHSTSVSALRQLVPRRPPSRRRHSLLYVGNFGYHPNADACHYLCEEVLPLVRDEIADASVWLVGNAMSPDIRRLGALPGVQVIGGVEDLEPWLRSAGVFVCPLRIGGGVKVKMLEAIRHEVPIVTSSIGAQGIAGIQRCAIIGDQPVEFAQAVISILTSRQVRERLRRGTRDVVADLPTWDDAADALDSCYASMLTARQSYDGERR